MILQCRISSPTTIVTAFSPHTSRIREKMVKILEHRLISIQRNISHLTHCAQFQEDQASLNACPATVPKPIPFAVLSTQPQQ